MVNIKRCLAQPLAGPDTFYRGAAIKPRLRKLANKKGVTFRLQPAQGGHDIIRRQVASGPFSVLLCQAHPFGNQHGLDPGGHAPQRLPNTQRHQCGAIFPQQADFYLQCRLRLRHTPIAGRENRLIIGKS